MCFFFFFKGPATTEIYTLPLRDALPICNPEIMAEALRRLPNQTPPSKAAIPGLLDGFINVNRMVAPRLLAPPSSNAKIARVRKTA